MRCLVGERMRAGKGARRMRLEFFGGARTALEARAAERPVPSRARACCVSSSCANTHERRTAKEM